MPRVARGAPRWVFAGLTAIAPLLVHAGAPEPQRLPLTLRSDDVLATGNEWIALPEILPDRAGRAFATAAGYVAHAICATACLPRH